jgi:hypothetical protein
VTFLGADGWSETLPLMRKEDVAEKLIARVARVLGDASNNQRGV